MQPVFRFRFSSFVRQGLLFCGLLSVFSSEAQQGYRLKVRNLTQAITLDGVLDERDWVLADTAGAFYQTFPYDTGFSKSRTVVRLAADEDNLYVAAECFDDHPELPYVIQSLKRDWSFPVSDAFVVTLDPFDDQTNGFSFGVNPMGAQREGAIEGGGNMGVTTAWDNRWYSEVGRYPGKWVVEMKIPLKSIRFTPGKKTWRINFARNNLKTNETSTWKPVPRNFNISVLTYTGSMDWEQPPVQSSVNAVLIPYVAARTTRDFSLLRKNPSLEPRNADARELQAGFDAKYTLAGSLNLDLTVNPDFSQVEVDQQQINLTRFSLFFPERRNFFIENSDLFANFGFRQIRPFFSRRIGLSNGQIIPILGGARLSGKVGRDWRVGLMNLTTRQDMGNDFDYQNYSVGAVQRQVFKTSNIAAIVVNRQRMGDYRGTASMFNRVAGLDFNLQSPSNRWKGKAFLHKSFSPDYPAQSHTHATWLMYSTRKVFAMWNHEYVGKNYNAEMGFTPRIFNPDATTGKIYRLSYWRFEPEVSRTFFPRSKLVNNIVLGVYNSTYLDSSFVVSEYDIKPYISFNFQNSAYIGIGWDKAYSKLFFPVDITGVSDTFLAAGGYYYNALNIEGNSNKRKPFNVLARTGYGSFYGGTKWSNRLELNYRLQPYGNWSVYTNYERIRIPDPKIHENILLIGARAEMSFTTSLFFTTFLQYNTQLDNFNVNARLQWRFRPVSDLFIVYSENYNSVLTVKNRGISVKLTWWINT